MFLSVSFSPLVHVLDLAHARFGRFSFSMALFGIAVRVSAMFLHGITESKRKVG